MNKKQIKQPGVSFADAAYISLNLSEKYFLTLYLKSWDEKTIRIVFSEVAQFVYKVGTVVQGLYEVLDQSSFLDEALSLIYETVPPDHKYKLYQLEDIYDFPFIQVVAESIYIFKD